MGYTGGFWIGLAVFIFIGVMLEHFGLASTTNSVLIGICFILFLIGNILSFVVGGDRD